MNFIYRPAQMKDLEELGHLFIETFIPVSYTHLDVYKRQLIQ